MNPRANSVLKWGALGVAAFVVLIVLLAAILQWNADAFRGSIARLASVRAGRPVSINGRLELHLLSLTPYVVATDVTLGNPAWAGGQNMAQLGHLEIAMDLPALFRAQVVLPRIKIMSLQLSLIRDAGDRANWRFESAENRPTAATAPPRLPVVRSFSLDHAHIQISDAIRKLHFVGDVAASDNATGGAQAMRLEGAGEMNGAPFSLVSRGDPLIGAEPARPYNFAASIRAGSTRLQFQAEIAKPFDLGSLQATFSASGRDLADVYYLTGLTLPNTAPYTLSGHLQMQGTDINLSDLAGTLGNSDVHGTMQVETGETRLKMQADLASRSLDMADLGPAFGAEPRKATSAAKGAPPRPEAPDESIKHGKSAQPSTQPLLPDAKLDLARVRGMDADVHYRAQSIQEQQVPFKEMAWHLQLNHGLLTIDPISFTLPQGKVAGRLRIDASHDVPDVALDARLSAVDLAEIHAKNGSPPLDGTLLARIAIHGKGRSVHEVASSADGTFTSVIPHGAVRSAFAELTGINVARGLGLLLTKNEQQTEIRCAVADFNSHEGVLAAQNIVIDTKTMRITGKGNIDLRNETLDLSINGQPKKIRFLTIKSPVVIRGALRKPSIALEAGHVAKQGAEAAALGALATPLAAILAFVDPGLAKDANCSALLEEARDKGVRASAVATEGRAARLP